MVEITVEGDRMVFEVEGLDKLWSLRSRLEIPLSHIKDANADPNPAMGWFQGVKLGGTSLPNVFRAGTFFQEGRVVFWDVHNPENTIVVDLDHEHYGRLVIEVAVPEAAVRLIKAEISVHGRKLQ